jgi:hypothetical protein
MPLTATSSSSSASHVDNNTKPVSPTATQGTKSQHEKEKKNNNLIVQNLPNENFDNGNIKLLVKRIRKRSIEGQARQNLKVRLDLEEIRRRSNDMTPNNSEVLEINETRQYLHTIFDEDILLLKIDTDSLEPSEFTLPSKNYDYVTQVILFNPTDSIAHFQIYNDTFDDSGRPQTVLPRSMGAVHCLPFLIEFKGLEGPVVAGVVPPTNDDGNQPDRPADDLGLEISDVLRGILLSTPAIESIKESYNTAAIDGLVERISRLAVEEVQNFVDGAGSIGTGTATGRVGNVGGGGGGGDVKEDKGKGKGNRRRVISEE